MAVKLMMLAWQLVPMQTKMNNEKIRSVEFMETLVQVELVGCVPIGWIGLVESWIIGFQYR